MALKSIGNGIRALLDRHGYLLLKREYARYGLSPFIDTVRIARSWDGAMRTVIDVGANAGQFAREALKELPAARVYSFEPHPSTFQRLTGAISDARLSAHQLALGERTGHATMYVYGDSGDGSLINSLVPDARFPTKFGYPATQITIPCVTLDAFCEQNKIEDIDLLKVDTEGSELLVLYGARRMMQQGRIRFVYVEFNALLPEAGTTGGALMPIAQYLAPFGFQYVVTYTDFVLHRNEISVCANALFAAPPAADSGVHSRPSS
jgi:FkbM family methyltransferase